ncbi:MAG: uracil-DNA glycosylase family protein [Rhodospirillales bacterium]|nr:uracil-DNA glycosylase family protein [Rhodospirillales bacterium]
MRADDLDQVLAEARACRHCEGALPLGPRPVLRAAASARLLIVGQAPGTRVHATGIPWNDASGDRLRLWLGLERDVFYDERRVAIVPMGLCYPGRDAGGGDKPPRRECAPLWHGRIVAALPNLQLTLLVGRYAQVRYLPAGGATSVTEAVRDWRAHGPRLWPLPHPSWRTIGWQRRHPWFEAELLPELRARVRALLTDADPYAVD